MGIIDWMRRIRCRRKKYPPGPVDILSAAERDSIIATHLNEPLASLGLVQVSPRRWVDGSAPPARRVFEMELLKGASMIARWGFSLDFVPHLSGHRICLHRSDQTARLDVIVVPRGLGNARYLFGAEHFRNDLRALVPKALRRAQKDWQRGSTWSGMLNIVQNIRDGRRKYRGLNHFYYTQIPLAFIFLSAKTGNLASALAELEIFACKYELTEEVVAKLTKLVQDIAAVGR